MAKAYKVAAPYVTLKWTDDRGSLVVTGFYQGAPVPESADEANVKRLLDKGMLIDAADPVADIVAVPAGTPMPGEPPNVPVEEVPSTSLDQRLDRARESLKAGRAKADTKPADTPATPAVADPPATNETKPVWVDYAVACGENRATAEAMSKEQLVGRFGKRG